ncbi:MAG: penicillin acylase family protein [bacterium]|nr:penicillin acylase family protein [bacterium]
MKLWKKILLGLLIVIFLALGGGYIYLRNISNRAIPNYNQNITLSNITGEVTVYRDRFAVPHIYAQNESDLYRATGYLMAQDRLWQLDLIRRATMGRLSEIFGKDLLKTDLLMRAIRMSDKSKLMLSKADPAVIAALDAFADGVNQFIQNNNDRLPPEFTILGYSPDKWEPYHSLNLVGYMAWDLAFAWDAEMILHKISQKVPGAKFNAMMPVLSQQKPAVFPDFSSPVTSKLSDGFDPGQSLLAGSRQLSGLGIGVFHGSNNWAVSGKKSTTGKPILANDMHLGIFIPGVWYQMHQVIDGQLNVTGVALPGQPFVVAGHNEHIAWGMTNVMVDDLDFYLETVNPGNPNQYKFNGQWKDMEIREETFKVKGGNIVKEELKFTHRGPVISRFKGIDNRSVSMRWIGNEYSSEATGVYHLNRARNWQEFRNAVKRFTSISQNIVYADTDGNIGLQTSAGLPIRKGGGQNLVPGDTDEFDWTGIVPFEELPYSYNPDSGYVSSANNKTVNEDYPHYISNWFIPPDRINRIREMLEEKEKLSIDDFKLMQGDFKSKHVEKFLGDILAVLKKARDLSAAETETLQLLSQWDGVLNRDSAAAAVFETLYAMLVKHLVKDELGEDLYDEYVGFKILPQNLVMNVWKSRDSGWCDNIRTEEKETFDQWIVSGFKDTVRQLREKQGGVPNQWQWGKLHRLVLRHPMGRVKILDFLFNFNRGPYEIGGSFHTVSPYSYSLRRPYDSGYGASQRHIYSAADWDRSLSIIPTGISGIPASPFYCDQTPLYIDNKYRNDFITKQPVQDHAKFKMTFSGSLTKNN